MTQKNLPQITKHFQAFIFWTIFANFRKLFWLWHNYQLTTNIWTQLRLPLMIKNRFSGAKITYKNRLFSIFPKNAKKSYLGPLVGVSILVHFSLSLSFKKFNLWSAQKLQLIFWGSKCSSSSSWSGSAQRVSLSSFGGGLASRAGGGGGTHRCPISLCTQ